jgi:hypothetical protein
MKVRLSKLATLEYREIIFNLADQYGDDKAMQFEIDFEAKRNQLRKFPFSFGTIFETKKRKFMVNPYITVIYIVNEDLKCIEILNFWFNRSNPEVLLQHL